MLVLDMFLYISVDVAIHTSRTLVVDCFNLFGQQTTYLLTYLLILTYLLTYLLHGPYMELYGMSGLCIVKLQF